MPDPSAATLARPAFSPLYQQIKSLLVRSLQEGEWLPGQAILSEQELAVRYNVSQGTVRKAIDELAAENLLVRRQGKGTFVATHAEAGTQFRFLRLAPDSGERAEMSRQLLQCQRGPASNEVQHALRLAPGAGVVQVRRLLLAGDRPVVLDELVLPDDLFADLSLERLQQWRGPLYRLFELHFSVRMIRAQERIKAVAASPEEAQLLQCAPASPLLSVERLSYTYDNRPVELRRGLYLTDHHHYRNDLN
jgi:GntR family transcriptional regulator